MFGWLISLSNRPAVAGPNPSLSNGRNTDDRSRSRITIDSPWIVGMLDTRMSTRRAFSAIRIRPSCGSRRSAMFSSAISLIRDVTAACSRRGGASRSYRIPSIRYRTRRLSSLGSMWMSEASEFTASSIRRFTSRTTGASNAMSRSWLTSSSPSASSPAPIPSTIFCIAVDAPYVRSMAARTASRGATHSLTWQPSV